MTNIENVTFYFANPKKDNEGNPLLNEPPESYTLTYQQVKDNVGIILSTGESIYTEIDINGRLKIINGFYFGLGKFGSILAVQYHYDDGTEGWIYQINNLSRSSENITSIQGNWIKDLSYKEIIEHPNWKGKPFVGYEDDYILVTIKRHVSLSISLAASKTSIKIGEIITVRVSYEDTCKIPGLSPKWSYDAGSIKTISRTDEEVMLEFTEAGMFPITYLAYNGCGQYDTESVEIFVEIDKNECELNLTPLQITINLGETASFDAIHPYPETGVWTYPDDCELIKETNKELKIKPKNKGTYSISYKVKNCYATAILYVFEDNAEIPDNDENPEEPLPPLLPDWPPEDVSDPQNVVDLKDAVKPKLQEYKYPQMIRRNARYRGHRESDKYLSSQQEQVYDIRKIYQDQQLQKKKQKEAIHSWFYGTEIKSNFMINQANQKNAREIYGNSAKRTNSSTGALEANVIQLSQLEQEQVVGINRIKEQMRELDERVSEAERRFKEYENAYK